MTTVDKNTGEILSKEHLLISLEEARENTRKAKETEGRIEMAIIQEATKEGGTSIPSDTYLCEVKVGIKYDPTVLVLLKEEMNKTDLDHCFEPEYTKTEIVEAHFKTTQTKATCIRNGGKQAEILKRSMIPEAPSLTFKRR